MLPSVFMIPVALGQDEICNICGEGNQINFPTGVVQFVYDGEVRKNNCNTWQNIVKNPNAISDSFCKNELLEFTHKVCRCTDSVGNPVVWEPPIAPSATPTVALSEETLAPTILPTDSPVTAFPTPISVVVAEDTNSPDADSDAIVTPRPTTASATSSSCTRSMAVVMGLASVVAALLMH